MARGYWTTATDRLAPGPNGTDDTSTLTAELASSATYVYLRAGTYFVTSTNSWPSNKFFIGHPDGTTIKAKDGTNLNWMFNISGARSKFGAENITFDANRAGQSSGGNGIFDFAAQTPTDTTWDRCTFTGSKTNSLSFKGSNHKFLRCRWYDAQQCIILTDGASNVVFDGSLFEQYSVGVSITCVSMQGVGGSRARFYDCTWINSASSTQFAIESVSPSLDLWHEVTMVGCTLDGNQIGGTGISGTFQNSLFSGNRWMNGRGSNRCGFEITGSNNRFTGNLFEATSSASVSAGAMCNFTGGGSGVWSSIRRGNAFTDNTVRLVTASDTSISGLAARDHSDLLIAGNTIDIAISGSGSVQSGIYLGVFGTGGTLRNVLCKDNTIRCSSTSGGNGIRVLPNVGVNETAGTNYGKNIRIEGNKIVGFGNGILLPSTANDTDVHVLNNEILTAGTAKISGALFGDGCIVANTVAAANDPYDGAISTKTGAYTATVLDRTIKASTATGFTLTLPPFPYKGQVLDIKRVTTEGSTLTIAANDSPIDGSLTSVTDTATNKPTFRFRGDRRSMTFTVTIATPGVVTATAHGFVDNQAVYISTSGALPTELVAGTKYFVRNSAANTFELSATSGGASIATSGTQSGTHTVTTAEWIRI